MKYTLISALLLCGATSLSANGTAATDKTSNDSTYNGIDRTYIQLYGGINKSANENLPGTELTKYPWAGGMFVGVGKELTPLWGWRTAFRYNHNKSRNVQTCESPDTWGWDNLGLFADATFDITDLFRPSVLHPAPKDAADATSTASTAKSDYKWNVKAFAGVGAAYTFGFDNVPLSYQHPYSRNSQMAVGLRAGITATYKVAKDWRVGMEVSQNFYTDNFNGVKADIPLDGRTNLKIGVTYMIPVKKKKTKPVPADIIYDTRLKVEDLPALPFQIPAKESTRKLVGRAFIDFIVDRTELRPDYRRNEQELKRMTASIDSVVYDKSIEIKSISLHGYASPESPYSHNVDLSLGRVRTIRDYLKNHYKLQSSVFTLKNTPEDWGNLRDFIKKNDPRRVKDDVWYESTSIIETPEVPDYVKEHTEELLEVISAVIDDKKDPDKMELELKRVGGGAPYKWLKDHVYPGLRHTDYIIEYSLNKCTVEEGRKMIYTHPKNMSLYDMYAVAKSYDEGEDGWLDALLIAAKEYPNDKTANLNAACACVMEKRLSDAKRYLKKAGETPEAQEVSNVISAMDGTKKWKIENGKVVLLEDKVKR